MLAILVWGVAILIVVGMLAAHYGAAKKPAAPLHIPGFDWLGDQVRSMALFVAGGKGTGKSFAIGRDLCFRTFKDGIPQIIIDPTGGVIDNFLQKFLEVSEKLPLSQQAALRHRIWYVDMEAKDGYVTSWPLYFRLGNESLYASAQRLIETIVRLYPALASAPVEGETALRTAASYIGMILTALDFQVSEAENLLQEPKKWQSGGWLNEAVKRYPEVQKAVTWIEKEYSKWAPEIRMRRTSSFRSKIEPSFLDPVQRAIFSGSQGIDFDVLKEQNVTLLVDFRHVTSTERLRFGMMWVFQWFLAQIRHRGLRQRPIHFCIDELSRMTNQDGPGGNSEFSKDIDTLLSVEARNRGVYVTLMLQGLWQVDERLQASLLSSGNLMLGHQSDLESARSLARHLFQYTGQPMVKRWEPIFSGSPNGPVLTGQRAIEYSLHEWEHLAANAFTKLPGFHFLVRAAEKEGTVTTPLLPMVVKEIGNWVNQEKVATLRRELVRQIGRPLEEVLAEIEQRLQHKPGDASATLSPNEPQGDLPPESEGQDGQGVIWETAAQSSSW